MTNPFLGYGRVVTGDRLVGREVEKYLREIIRLGSGSLSIIGEPRIGKPLWFMRSSKISAVRILCAVLG